MFYSILGQQLRRTLPVPLVYGGEIIQQPTDEQYRAAGWREVVPDSTPVPEGYRVADRTYATDETHAYESLSFEPVPAAVNPLEPYAAEIAAFQAVWAGAGMGGIPEDWSDAMQQLEAAEVDDRTLIRLLALRMALAPVWGLVLAMGGEVEG